MTLFEILRRDLKEWPWVDVGFCAYQCWDGRIFFLNGTADYENGSWSYRSGLKMTKGPKLDIAEDNWYAFVTYLQWEESK